MTRPEPPVEVGDVRTVTVEETGNDGDGIAYVERGYVLIISGASVGEEVKVEVEGVYERYAFADLLQHVDTQPSPSPDESPQGSDLSGSSSKYPSPSLRE